MVVSLGGNVIHEPNKGSSREQLDKVKQAAEIIVEMLKDNYHIALTHGNGPQVGNILLAYDFAKQTVPPMPLDVCVAETQGMIGYMLQMSLINALNHAKINKSVVPIITQTIIKGTDTRLRMSSKPIGPYYTGVEASNLRQDRGWVLVDESGRGYRRVVPSPFPIGFIEEQSIKTNYENGNLVIAAGGGGIPVMINKSGIFQGVEAVVDKDHTASRLATLLDTEILLTITDVDKIDLNYGKANQTCIDHMTVLEAKENLIKGQFPPGNMGPKIESSINFIENGGKKAIITSLGHCLESLKGNAGTTITLE